jgi:FtsP/CotA-like multicopper oxidase with cupredoxin domain
MDVSRRDFSLRGAIGTARPGVSGGRPHKVGLQSNGTIYIGKPKHHGPSVPFARTLLFVLGKPDMLNLSDPVQKDSVNVPANSTLLLQWTTTNPGHWFFHCHIEWHLATGMARVIEIA